jgi:hypothetical protein
MSRRFGNSPDIRFYFTQVFARLRSFRPLYAKGNLPVFIYCKNLYIK